MGLTTVNYQVDGVCYYREMFASYEEDIISVKISSNKAGKLNFDLSVTSPLIYQVSNTKSGIFLEGQAPYFAELSYTLEKLNTHPIMVTFLVDMAWLRNVLLVTRYGSQDEECINCSLESTRIEL